MKVQWVAIDDVDLLKRDRENMTRHCVKTIPEIGLTKDIADEAIALLLT